MWHKENLLNLVEKMVPEEYDAIAWIDADIWFQRLDWYDATREALEKYGVVQMFEKLVLTGQDGRPNGIVASAGYAGELDVCRTSPGFAWAARRSLWHSGGGLYERAVIGGGDMLNAGAWLGKSASDLAWLNYTGIEDRVNGLRTWCHSEGGCGGVSIVAFHEWHGDRAQRRYVERHQMMKSLDVETQIVRRDDGLLEFAKSVPETLCVQIQEYFASRTEDGYPSRQRKDELLPFMDGTDLAAVARLLCMEDRILEFGCGGSTVWLASRVQEIQSIEHDYAWAVRVIAAAPKNAVIHWRPPAFPSPPFTPAEPGQYDEYLRVPAQIRQTFNACLIDGRARIESALAAAPWLKPGGWLFFHDWFKRERYMSRIGELDEFYELREEHCVRASSQTLAVFRRKGDVV